MVKAGYLYDNAPIKHHFNSLRNELINEHIYKTPIEARYTV